MSNLGFTAAVSAFIYTLTISIATVGLTMLYHRLAGHEIAEREA